MLDHIERVAPISEAWSDEPWTIDGAAVRVSLACFAPPTFTPEVRLDGRVVPRVHTDLTGIPDLDLTRGDACQPMPEWRSWATQRAAGSMCRVI